MTRLSFASFAAAFLIAIVFVPLFLVALTNSAAPAASLPEGFYLGITASGNVTQCKQLIDKAKGLANLVVITDSDLTMNKADLDEVTDYAYKADMNFIPFMVYPSPFVHFNYDPFVWAAQAKTKYGSKFLGFYVWDEPGGNQLDRGNFRQFDNNTRPPDYRNAANTYVYYLYVQIRDFIKIDKLFTSDYGLYWYDYEAGYDVLFVQLGLNHTRATDLAQVRGAAEMHNKTWGAIITWTFDEPPYIESPDEMYNDMVLAYDSGAKYVVVFNYPTNLTDNGILTQLHYQTIANFRDYVEQNPQNASSNIERVAYVLPDNYGWGLRRPDDTIWGVWPADGNSTKIWTDVNKMIQKYGTGFDIVVGSPWTRLFWRQHYNKVIWWNNATAIIG
jgi:hypothetical protein